MQKKFFNTLLQIGVVFFMSFFSFLIQASVILNPSFSVESRWDTGYTGKVIIQNSSTTAVTSWQLDFELPQGHSLDSLWNGIVTQSNQKLSVTNETWNGQIQPGASVAIGFSIIKPQGSEPSVLNLSGVGMTTNEPINNSDQLSSGFNLNTHYVIDNAWSTGFQATVVIQNSSSQATSMWTASFNLPSGASVSNLWNGNYTTDGQMVNVTNPSWSGGGIISAGGSTTFGLTVNTNGAAQELLNLSAMANGSSNQTTDPDPIPATPILNQISADPLSPRNFTVSWQSVDYATQYMLQESLTADFAQPTTITNAATLSYNFTNKANGTYYYRVSASNNSGMSPYSATQIITIYIDPAIQLSAPVLNPITNDNSGNYSISWSSVENAQEYVLEESTMGDFSNPITIFIGAATSYAITNKQPGSYYYRVKAKSGTYVSPASAVKMISIFDPSSGQKDYKIIAYFPNWAMYRYNPFQAHNIDATLVTHINYAFINYDQAGNLILFDPWSDVQFGQLSTDPYGGNFRQLYNLKQQYPHLKTLFSVGGWTLANNFSPMVADSTARAHFVQECISFCEKYDFDGVDIDWEYPQFADHNGHPEDTVNFTLLLQELHAAAKAHSPQLLVTIAAPAGPWHYKNIEVSKIHQYLDWINLMCYDFWGAGWSTITNHNAPLYSPAQEDAHVNSQLAVEYYLSQGVPKEKLVMGMPIYGRSFGNVQSNADGLFAPYDGPGKGSTDQEPGMRFFFDIKNNLLPNYTRYWDDQAKVPYLYNKNLKEFVGYDDPESLAIKCNYVKTQGLAGAMLWEISLDTWPVWDCMKTINNILKS